MSAPALNTERELYRENTGDPAGAYYENSIFVTESGAIGMNVGGTVICQPIADWHEMASTAHLRKIKASSLGCAAPVVMPMPTTAAALGAFHRELLEVGIPEELAAALLIDRNRAMGIEPLRVKAISEEASV
jgi:hypothetical protein